MGVSVLIALTILGDPIWPPDGVIPPPARETAGYEPTDRPLWLRTAIAANTHAA